MTDETPGYAGVTEAEGVIYFCGGRFPSNQQSNSNYNLRTKICAKIKQIIYIELIMTLYFTDKCYMFDTEAPAAGWQETQEMSYKDPLLQFGLVTHAAKLFAFSRVTCGTTKGKINKVIHYS